MKKYRLVAFDVDGTLVDDTVFVWETLHNFFKTDRQKVERAFDLYMQGKITYAEWFENDIRLLREKGANRNTIYQAIAGMKLMPGAIETLQKLKEHGMITIILSGSLNIVLDKLGLWDYFDEVYVNRLEFGPDGELVAWQPTPYDVWDKAEGLKQAALKYDVPIEQTVFVGDNFNDVAVAKIAGLAIAFNCKSEELAKVSDVVIKEKDLRKILPHILQNG